MTWPGKQSTAVEQLHAPTESCGQERPALLPLLPGAGCANVHIHQALHAWQQISRSYRKIVTTNWAISCPIALKYRQLHENLMPNLNLL